MANTVPLPELPVVIIVVPYKVLPDKIKPPRDWLPPPVPVKECRGVKVCAATGVAMSPEQANKRNRFLMHALIIDSGFSLPHLNTNTVPTGFILILTH